MRCIELPRYRASLGSQRHHRTSHYAPPQWVRSVIDGEPHPSKRLPAHQRRIDIQLLDRAQRPPLLGHRAPPHTPCQEPRRLVGTAPTPPNVLRENERATHQAPSHQTTTIDLALFLRPNIWTTLPAVGGVRPPLPAVWGTRVRVPSSSFAVGGAVLAVRLGRSCTPPAMARSNNLLCHSMGHHHLDLSINNPSPTSASTSSTTSSTSSSDIHHAFGAFDHEPHHSKGRRLRAVECLCGSARL